MNRYGHGRVALIGFPSVGKSTLLSELTSTESEAASYEFTTLTCIPGVINITTRRYNYWIARDYRRCQREGRGRQVIAVAKSSDLILMVLDAMK